jgi:glucose/arabinose dehydrogenase
MNSRTEYTARILLLVLIASAAAYASFACSPNNQGLGENPGDNGAVDDYFPPLPEIGLERVFSWYDPDRPTHLEESPDASGRIYVSEQDGRLVELTGDPAAPTGSTRVVLDMTVKVSTNIREEGLLGFAFHPNLARGNRIFIYYSAASPRRSVISEFLFSPDGMVDPTSERVVMEIPQPFGNHNGGMLLFGADGKLYISLGDGGGAGDTAGNAQNTSTVLGSILRIDVDTPGVPYSVPADNPFVGTIAANGQPSRGEIWAYGLRNPWRLAFDHETGDLWAADVGQNDNEEVNLIVKGGNYGWNVFEGDDCYKPERGCEDIAPAGVISPVTSYNHRLGCSITGGYVYHGDRVPSLEGAYLYSDFCSGTVWALRQPHKLDDDGHAASTEVLESGYQVPAFGQTLDGEVYLLAYTPGIYRFVER